MGVVLSASGVVLAGCGAPPSVVPLLTVTEQTLNAEAAHLETDGQREDQWIEQTRQALKQAYQQDLQARSKLSPDWITEATEAYVAAREELVRHQMQRQQQRAIRQENLRAAAEATQQAAALLQQQDELLTRLAGEHVWKLLKQDTTAE